MRVWLASLTDTDLDAPPVRDEDRLPLWMSSCHQFSDVAVLLTVAGHSPDDIGFLEFVASRPPRADQPATDAGAPTPSASRRSSHGAAPSEVKIWRASPISGSASGACS